MKSEKRVSCPWSVVSCLSFIGSTPAMERNGLYGTNNGQLTTDN